jgi:hypothetical protein
MKILKYIISMAMVSLVLYGCYYDKEIIFDGLPQNVSLKNDLVPIFTSNCTTSGCHDAIPSHAPSLVADNAYDALLGGGYVNVLDPEKSIIYQEIAAGNMPPSGALSVNDQKILLAWISEGANDN